MASRLRPLPFPRRALKAGGIQVKNYRPIFWKMRFWSFFFCQSTSLAQKTSQPKFWPYRTSGTTPPYVNRLFWGWSGFRGQKFQSLKSVWNFFYKKYMTWVICRYFYFLIWAIFGRATGSQSWDANKEYTTARGDPDTNMLRKTPLATPLPPVLKVFNQSQQHTKHPQKISGLCFTVFRRYSNNKLLFW